MLHWVLFGLFLAAEASQPEVQAKESAPTIKILQLPAPSHDHHDRDYNRDLNYQPRYNPEELDQYIPGPLVASKFDPHHVSQAHPDVAKQIKIIKETYSPVRAEPAKILDYRYLKTGGRDYVRGPGGQILILPKHVKSPVHNEHPDYDSLIEFLRLKNIADHEAMNGKNRNNNQGELNLSYEAVTGYGHHHNEHAGHPHNEHAGHHQQERVHHGHHAKLPDAPRNQDNGMRMFEPKVTKDQELWQQLLDKAHYH